MSWKKSYTASKRRRGICYFAAEGFGFSKEVLRFVAKLLYTLGVLSYTLP